MRTALLIGIVILFAAQAWCMPFIGVDTGLLFIVNTEAAGAPSPVILQGLGITLPLVADEGFYLDTGLLFYGCQYQYVSERAIPADTERADTVWVLFAQLDLRAGFDVKLSQEVTFGGTLGPAIIFPFPLFAYDNGAAYRDSMYAFFYNNKKLFYAEAELFLRWGIVSGINLTLKTRGLYPLAALWDDASIPRYNGIIIEGIVSIEVHL
jgi:hypothetical protein